MSRLAVHVRVFGWRGVAYALINYNKNIGRLAKVRSKYSRHPLFLRLNTSDIDVFKQVFIEHEYDIVKLVDTDIDTIVDAGANIGLTTVFLANKYPDARICAIEPDAGNFDILRRNTSKYTNVCCELGAVWNSDALVRIADRDAQSWAFRVDSADDAGDGSVPGYRLGTIMNKHDMSRITLLKMDIEGAEFEVLSDVTSWIASVDNIVIELHDRIRPGVSELFRSATGDFTVRAVSDELTLVCRRDH